MAGVVGWIPSAAVPDSMDLVAGALVFERASLGAVGADRVGSGGGQVMRA